MSKLVGFIDYETASPETSPGNTPLNPLSRGEILDLF
jgi:hypothetical protein